MMIVTIKTPKKTINKTLMYQKTGKNMYAVFVDEKEIGTVYKAEGRIKKFRFCLLDGTQTVDRWFAKTVEGVRLGPQHPYDEGCSSRREATIELFEDFFGVRRDPDNY